MVCVWLLVVLENSFRRIVWENFGFFPDSASKLTSLTVRKD